MTQILAVNGKEYLPSNLLADRHNYTPDYITKLARDEKILATRIGRQWFVEPASLESFLHQIEIEKKVRKEELSRKRKIEHSLHQQKQAVEQVKTLGSPAQAVAQTVAVVLCGLLVGGLGFAAADAKLTTSELSRGFSQNVQSVVFAVLPSHTTRKGDSQVAASAESFSVTHKVTEPNLVFTQLPEFPPRTSPASSSTSSLEYTGITGEFSDEVRVESQDDGTQVIIPIFRSGEGRQFMLVPVTNASNEYAQ